MLCRDGRQSTTAFGFLCRIEPGTVVLHDSVEGDVLGYNFSSRHVYMPFEFRVDVDSGCQFPKLTARGGFK